MIYIQLFWSFFQIGLFSIGGGYAAMPLIQNQTVEIHHWLTMTQFTDLITISQMTPGPIAINSATFVGDRIAGVAGAVISTIGCVLPSCVISLFLAYIYYRYKTLSYVQGLLGGLRPAIVALIGSAGLSILIMAFFGSQTIYLPDVDFISVGLFALSIIALRVFKPNPILVMVGSGIAGMALYLLL